MEMKKTKDLVEVEVDVYVAKDINVEEAIFYAKVECLCEEHKNNNENLYDGYYWTRSSKKEFTKLFSFWNERQIRTIIKNLVEKEYIVLGKFNEDKFDNTNWYRINKKVLPNGNMFIVPKIIQEII